jgi:hypothetical protein
MRSCIFILILWRLLQPAGALAEEVLMGTVVSVDSGKGGFVLRPLGNEDATDDISVKITAQYPHLEIEPGVTLRVWGEIESESDGRFVATDIARGDPRGPFSDQTGVRRRLMRGRFQSPGGGGHGPRGGRR